MFSFAFFFVIIRIYIALEFCFGLGKHYLWFRSLLLFGLYHPELSYAFLHAMIISGSDLAERVSACSIVVSGLCQI